jgi:hypothetical protein
MSDRVSLNLEGLFFQRWEKEWGRLFGGNEEGRPLDLPMQQAK